jgi:hypothetical protein
MDGDKVLIVMTSGPSTPQRCASPFLLARAATAMASEVRLVFMIDGVLLLKPEVAEATVAIEGGRSVAGFIEDTLEAGVHLCACTPSLQLHGLTPEDLVEGVEMIGGAALLAWAAESQTVLSF